MSTRIAIPLTLTILMSSLFFFSQSEYAGAHDGVPAPKKTTAPRIRSYIAFIHSGNPGVSTTIIPAVEGENGLIITDISASSDAPHPVTFQMTEAGCCTKVQMNVSGEGPSSVHFRSGIPVSAGSQVTIQYTGGLTSSLNDTTVVVTLSGYIY